MKKIYLSGNYVTVIYDGTNERLYPISQVQLSEFTDHFLIENRIENQPKDTQVSFASVGTWFNEAGDTAYTVESLRIFFTGISAVGVTSTEVKSDIQGYYSLLSNYYFTGGLATERIITTAEAGTWLDIELTIDANGVFDNRPTGMKTAQAVGHLGSGALGDPICFKLEGLTTTSSADLRTAFTFDPDEDGGRVESRLLFKRHSGTTPASDFVIEATSLSMESGADLEYSNTPNVQFFIGDTIDTNAPGDAGTVQVQIKVDVAGTISMREVALFIES